MKNPDNPIGQVRNSEAQGRRDNSSDRETDTRGRPLHEEISNHARALWEKYGQPSGRDEQIWLEAEQQLLGASREVKRTGEGSVSAESLRETEPKAQPYYTPSQGLESTAKTSRKKSK